MSYGPTVAPFSIAAIEFASEGIGVAAALGAFWVIPSVGVAAVLRTLEALII
jgi:hypothetical protein